MSVAHKRKQKIKTTQNKISSVLEKALLKMSFCKKIFDWFSIQYLANPFLIPALTILYEDWFLIEILDYNTATQFVHCNFYT